MKLEINNVIQTLDNRGVILYPTDTVWGIGCDATDEVAVKKVYKIKRRDESKSLVVLVDSLQMLQQYVGDIPRKAKQVLKTAIKPTTIIYNNPKGLARNVTAKDNTVAIRIIQDEFCQTLIKNFGKPIVSTSANISEKSTPKSFKEIDISILEAVDYIVNLRQDVIADAPSRILKILENGELKVIRE